MPGWLRRILALSRHARSAAGQAGSGEAWANRHTARPVIQAVQLDRPALAAQGRHPRARAARISVDGMNSVERQRPLEQARSH